MKRLTVQIVGQITVVIALLSSVGCTGHQYEPRPSGVTISGKSHIGVSFKNGQATPDNSTVLSVGFGG